MSISRKPDIKNVYNNFDYFIAFSFGVGLLSKAPGTFGTVVSIPIFYFFETFFFFNIYIKLFMILVFFSVGVWVSSSVSKKLGIVDYKGIVWDETVAFLLVLFLIPTEFVIQLFAFIVFRFFDIVKPFPINFIDKNFKNGFGIMFDDVLAAFYTLITIWTFIKLNG